MKHRLPRVMVFEFQKELTHSVWIDFEYRNRTLNGLIKTLRKMVENGEIIGFRLIRVEEQHLGITWKLPRNFARCRVCWKRIRKGDTSCKSCGATDFDT